MSTPDGWRVKVVEINNDLFFHVTRLGSTVALHHTLAEVANTMGEAFDRLVEE